MSDLTKDVPKGTLTKEETIVYLIEVDNRFLIEPSVMRNAIYSACHYLDEDSAKDPQECEFAHYKDLAEQGRLVDIETYQKRLIRYIDAGKYRSADKKVFSENDVIYLIEHGVFQCEAEQGKYLQKGRDDR